MSDVVGALRRYRDVLGRQPIKAWTLDEQREEVAAVDAALAALAWRDKPDGVGWWWQRMGEGRIVVEIVDTGDVAGLCVLERRWDGEDQLHPVRAMPDAEYAPVALPPEDQP